MKNHIFLFTFLLLLLGGCSSDEEVANDSYDNSCILGSWHDISITEGDYVSSALDVIWTFNVDNTATQRVILSINGVKQKDENLTFSYKYLGKHIELMDETGNITDYSIKVEGDYMSMGNISDGYFDLKNLSVDEELNCINYATTDGKPLSINSPSSFKSIIVTNEYINGKGIIRFAKTLKSLPNEAFRESKNLYKMSLPDSVSILGWACFQDCENLYKIDLPEKMQKWSDYTFYGCSNLSEIEIPEGLTYIHGFSECSNLSKVTLPKTSEIIGFSAFSNCENLEYINIPGSIKHIQECAFENCGKLKGITLPNNLEKVKSNAFKNCSMLTSIVVPKNTTFVENYAFDGCSSVQSIDVDDKNIKYDSRNNCNAIINSSNNSLIVGCQNTVIPSTVKVIGYGAFSNNKKIKSQFIPASVDTIRMYAFQNCINLEKVTIEEGMKQIDAYSFLGCSKLTEISFPKSVTCIGGSVLKECSSLTKIYAYSEVPPTIETVNWSSDLGLPDYSKVTLFVPEGCKDVYKHTKGWFQFNNIQEM